MLVHFRNLLVNQPPGTVSHVSVNASSCMKLEVSKNPRWAVDASFMKLLEANVDYFGVEARATYDPGYAVAIEVDTGGDLKTALAINAFADHVLQDSFAAGHIRVPRKEIAEIAKYHTYSIPFFKHEDIAKIINASSNVMHNEDGELGLWLESPSGEKWKTLGDGRLPGRDSSSTLTKINLDKCRKAVKQSISEAHDAFKNKNGIQASEFAAWHHAPIMDKVFEHPENPNPLLRVEDGKLVARINGASSKKYEAIVRQHIGHVDHVMA
ncbi:hypothetical protein FBEOM_7083 [Fusarium beomiforme]|uniref:Uncharacterized protein n=1 Tax=Fusarium beomiforme TaxID=44412 RepID=A0A9P5DVQ7_9HYPO|nr:hypothetical protein FBEOM_7083 [Fusarium beomiforme]